MNYSNFNELLKDLRIQKGWSQEEACEGVCDRRTYIRWEKGISKPSDYYLHILSYRFNYDLQAYYKMFICNGSSEVLSYKEKAYDMIEKKEWHLLYEFIEDVETHHEFKVGENKETLLYYKALYYFECEKNYMTSIKYCMDGLKAENSNIVDTNPSEKIYSNVGICILNCLATCYEKLQETANAKDIYIGILENIENKIVSTITFYQSTEFEKNIYLVVAYNLGLNYKEDNEIEQSLNYINKGINFSLKHHYMNGLADLLKLKYKILYQQGNFLVSKQAFEQCTSLYLLQNNMKEYNSCLDGLYSIYPSIM